MNELVWKGDTFGVFSVKSLIELAYQNVLGSVGHLPLVWSSVAPPRVQMFNWCCAKKKILTRSELMRRGILSTDGDSLCPLCRSANESFDHLLVTCPTS